MKDISVVLSGVGGVGRNLTRLLTARPGYRIVAAYSRNERFAGKDLGLLAGIDQLGVNVITDRNQALRQPADILLVATTSFLKDIDVDLKAGIANGINIITTAEEAAYPWIIDEELANELDQKAKDHSVSILGVGLNPGFIFDALMLTATGVAWDIQSIHLRRVVNISRFSATIQRRLGIGFSGAEFEAGVQNGVITGHIGFPETFSLAAKCVGHQLSDIEKTFIPLLADQPYENEYLLVAKGQTGGFIQQVIGYVGSNPWINAEFIAHVEPESIDLKAEDSITINGFNSINLTISPGCNPQLGSAAMVANCIPRVIEARAGFLTVADLAIPHARFTNL